MAVSIRGMHGKFGDIEQMLWEDSMTFALGVRFLTRVLRVGDPEEALLQDFSGILAEPYLINKILMFIAISHLVPVSPAFFYGSGLDRFII